MTHVNNAIWTPETEFIIGEMMNMLPIVKFPSQGGLTQCIPNLLFLAGMYR